MEVTNTMGAAEVLRKYLLEADPDLVRSMVQTFAEALMSAPVHAYAVALIKVFQGLGRAISTSAEMRTGRSRGTVVTPMRHGRGFRSPLRAGR